LLFATWRRGGLAGLMAVTNALVLLGAAVTYFGLLPVRRSGPVWCAPAACLFSSLRLCHATVWTGTFRVSLPGVAAKDGQESDGVKVSPTGAAVMKTRSPGLRPDLARRAAVVLAIVCGMAIVPTRLLTAWCPLHRRPRCQPSY